MSLQSLKCLLPLLDPERLVWIVPGRRSIPAAAIAEMVASSGALLDRVRGRNVAVLARSEDELAPLLVLLDGACGQLTLLPVTVTRDRLPRLVDRSGSDLLITTTPDPVSPVACEVLVVEPKSLWTGSPDVRDTGSVPDLPTRWLFPTSGTTGEPKLVPHTLASLTRTVKQDLDRGSAHRWGSLYDLTGFAGLQVFLQSWYGGSALILGRHGATFEERVSDLVSASCTALSATPTMWRKLLMTGEAHRLALRQITLGGEIVDQKILDTLSAMFPAASIVHIYASTEAGVGFAVRDGQAGFPVSFVDDPPSGARIAVDREGGLLVEAGEEFVDTGDVVREQGGRFVFLGRADGTINVGGNKVHPEEVEDFLLGCDGVRLARVTGRSSPFTGSVVQAEVVGETDAEELRASILARCRAELAPHKVPAVLRIVPSLDATGSGKLRRVD